jgi:GNAT superfamily N-acetyltransferase
MSEVRAPQAAELPKVVHFLDEYLRRDNDWSITREYPLAFSQRNLGNVRILEDQGEVLSHAVIKRLLIRTPVGLFNVAAIGSVVTHPQHRGKGLAQKVVADCLQQAEKQNCDFAILWTDLFDYYRKMGFELAGHEVSLVLENDPGPQDTEHKFLETLKVDPQALHKVYDQHSTTTLRSAQDFRSFLNIPNTRLFTSWSPDNRLLAYCVVGRGADLTGYAHEWGGGTEELLSLFKYVRHSIGQALTVITPKHCQNLIRQMEGLGATLAKGYLGMIKPVHPQHLIFKAHRLARAQGIEGFVLERQEGGYLFGYKNNLYRLPTEAAFTRLIFGPDRIADLPHIDKETQEAIGKVLPFPMWVWGWDSV